MIVGIEQHWEYYSALSGARNRRSDSEHQNVQSSRFVRMKIS
jgi:hypothetical protein